ncbi:hypothetical protein SPRG_13119 [Saprolegnia parasitica CBS 223.65]|uniref:Uncharacterized protein n=1 Tax=Saprolegnia parasitica (strain CBS 223.65) TaxID=695850 RepID=A0A067C540_SAPPC|nr:hypothetical protein SPRG_13119 [Saprolegnia parasitica CBS 223.65]KDO21937.1 hypothetical protein SPRG_13119 [Saprolegnia parasitica CBS 223.65]|eukprot:XP_012207378.1 hypothetical protein SPRG_13119 [Saprolegnia parasitica CBS 223.65]
MGNNASLHECCRTGDLDGLASLLASSETADVEKADEDGRTALLVAAGSDPEVKSPSPTPQALESDAIKAAAHSVQHEKKQIVLEMIKMLVAKEANLDHRDEKGWTALHHACQAQNDVAIVHLLQLGAMPTRDALGLLPQDLLLHNGYPDSIQHAEDLHAVLTRVTEPTSYKMSLLSLRSSGIAEIRLGAHLEKGSVVTVEFDIPENHSPKDYVQLLIYNEEGDQNIDVGPTQLVPPGTNGQVAFKCDYGSPPCIYRFVYVKCDINAISRVVVASGCTASVQTSVGEVFQYELYLYDRVVEVESVTEYEFFDQPTIALKRIGLGSPDDIDWIDVLPENHIVAVNDVVIAGMSFEAAIRQLQMNNGTKCTKLLMQNSVAIGDFIHEKILGVGVIGKYASLQPVELPDDFTPAPTTEHTPERSPTEMHDTEEAPVLTTKPGPSDSAASDDFYDAMSPTSSLQAPSSPLIGVATANTLPNTMQMVGDMFEGIAVSTKTEVH